MRQFENYKSVLFVTHCNHILVSLQEWDKRSRSFEVSPFKHCKYIIVQVYISEIARPELRGRLSSGLKVFSHLGLLSSFVMGAWLNWRQLAIVCGSAPLMLLVTMQYNPESPSYLVYSGQLRRAARSLQVQPCA